MNKNKETHAIIQFENDYTCDGKNLINLVPCSWLHKSKDGMYCLYPSESLNRMIRGWVKQSKEPNTKWKKNEIKILQYARNYCISCFKNLYTGILKRSH